jgi:hypothetical protein
LNKHFVTRSLTSSCVAAACLFTVMATEARANDRDTTTQVNGVISKIETGRISVATAWGHMSMQSDALSHAKVGDAITAWVNESNVVIDAYPKGEARPEHRWVLGNLTSASGNKKEITLSTPEGEKAFKVERNRPKFTMFQDGAPITVQLNDKGDVIDVHRQLQLGPAVIPVRHTQPGFRIKLEGVVARIKSGQVFVKTPGAEYSLTAKSALPDVKVGDELTIWVSDNNVAVDHHAKGKAGAHRYIMGHLTSASGDMKEITLMTLQGTRSFSVPHGESTLSGMKEGTPITLELNEAGNVIEIRKIG